MFDSKINPQIDEDDIDFFLSNDVSLQPDIYDFEKLKLRKLMKDKNKKKYIEHILENKDILNFDDEDLYNEISKNFSDSDVVDLVFKLLSKRIKNINEKALTFRDNIIKKYRYLHNPQKIIEKANKYMRYLNLTPEEKTIFINSFKKNFKTPLTGDDYKGPKELQGQFNSMSKFFNYNARTTGKLNFENSDVPIIKEIINLTNSHNEMYNNNISHIIKTNYAITKDGITKYYDGILVNPNAKITDCIPPIIFALFANVIPTLDKNLLISNIGMVVKKSYEHKILNYYEQELINSLAHDTDEYIDKSGNTLTVAQDLLYRVKIQISLWKLVLFLRTKHIFDCDCTTFYKLLSIYSPDILNTNENDICSDSIDIMSKIFNIVCFKPIEFKYSYKVNEYEDKRFGVMPLIIKQGRDNSLYLVNSQKINSLQEGIEQYYNSKSNRTEKIPFIYIKQSEDKTTKVDIDGKKLKLIYGESGKAKEQNLSTVKQKPYIEREIKKSGEIESIDNVLIFVVVRTQTVINKQNKLYINNQPLTYDMGSYGTSFNTNKVFFGGKPRYDSPEQGIYDISLMHNSKHYHLSSVLLYTVYNESLSQDPSDGLKIKGNPYAIVLQRKLASGGHYRHIVYQPYVLSTFSHSMNDESPISAFDTSTEDNRKGLVDIVYRYGEIYIFRDLDDKLVPITHEFDSSAQPAQSANNGAAQSVNNGAAPPPPAAVPASSGASQSVGSKQPKIRGKKGKKFGKFGFDFGSSDDEDGSGSESEKENEGDASVLDGSKPESSSLRKKSKKEKPKRPERGAYRKDSNGGDDDDDDDDDDTATTTTTTVI